MVDAAHSNFIVLCAEYKARGGDFYSWQTEIYRAWRGMGFWDEQHQNQDIIPFCFLTQIEEIANNTTIV